MRTPVQIRLNEGKLGHSDATYTDCAESAESMTIFDTARWLQAKCTFDFHESRRQALRIAGLFATTIAFPPDLPHANLAEKIMIAAARWCSKKPGFMGDLPQDKPAGSIVRTSAGQAHWYLRKF
jgi:hypothetical protein